jgi:hypothetical protein
MTATVKNKQPTRRPRGPTRYPDLMGAALLIGYHHSHLARALNGERNAAHVAAALEAIGHPLAVIAQQRLAQHPS